MSFLIASRLLLAIVVCATATYVARPGLQAASTASQRPAEALRSPKRPAYRGDVRRAAWVGSRQASGLFDRYAAGDHDAAIESLDPRMTAGALRAAADAWVRDSDASSLATRQRVAAAVTLEAVWAATRGREVLWDFEWKNTWAKPWDARLLDVRSVLPIVAWGCDVISNAEGSHQADAIWFLASVGVLQDVRASAALLEYRGQPGPQPTWDPVVRRDLAGGHLVHARAHAPNESRWKMAELLAQAERDLGIPPIHQRPGVLRNAVWRPEALPRIQKRLASLAEIPQLAGEARLRIAYADVQRRRWREALAEIDRARPSLTEPFLIAVAEYLRGWATEQLGQPAEAIAAYRSTLEIAPGMRNVTTLLAAQMYAANQRREAYQLLEEMYATPSHPRDLIVQFERGDARLVPDYFGRLREALR